VLAELLDESVALFHRLKAAAATIYGDGEASAGRRGVLRSLAQLGPQTVPDLARRRPVSRQHIQVLVNDLLRDGLALVEQNPAHLRSHLIKLTAKGERRVEQIEQTDARVIAAVAKHLSAAGLRGAIQTLREVRRALEDEPRWLSALEPPPKDSGRPTAERRKTKERKHDAL
jgi:DNA-binding MarR family transcriptional regulator